MASTAITINVDNTVVNTVIAALAWQYGWQNGLAPDGTAMTQNQAAKKQLFANIKTTVKSYQVSQATDAVAPIADNLFS